MRNNVSQVAPSEHSAAVDSLEVIFDVSGDTSLIIWRILVLTLQVYLYTQDF